MNSHFAPGEEVAAVSLLWVLQLHNDIFVWTFLWQSLSPAVWFLSDEGPMLETLDHSIYYPYWQYADLFIFRFVSLLCLRSALRLCLHNNRPISFKTLYLKLNIHNIEHTVRQSKIACIAVVYTYCFPGCYFRKVSDMIQLACFICFIYCMICLILAIKGNQNITLNILYSIIFDKVKDIFIDNRLKIRFCC